MKHLSICIDLVFCLVVLPVMMMIFPIERWYHHFQWYVVVVAVWLYGIYVLNRTVTVPLLFKGRRNAWMAVGLMAVSVVMTFVLSDMDLYSPRPSIYDVGFSRILPDIPQHQQAILSLFMIVEAFSFAVGLLIQTGIQWSRRRAVEAERDIAENRLCMAQIKPHFMFNTLNSLYGLFLTHDDKALASLEQYITMMRYIHTSSLRDMVPLAEEADYIRQYVGLQQLRLNGMTVVTLELDVPDNTHVVPPMLFVTFVENCFKFGVSPVERSNIQIVMKLRERRLEFRTVNRVFPVKQTGAHLGIDNCRRRLELIYPGRYRLYIGVVERDFIVNLSIDLTE